MSWQHGRKTLIYFLSGSGSDVHGDLVTVNSYSITSRSADDVSDPRQRRQSRKVKGERRKHKLIMLGGYQQCVISSTSSHVKSGGWRRGCAAWKETQEIYYPHAVYSVLSSCCCTCVNHSLPVKSLTSVTGSQGNWIPAQTKRSFTWAQLANDSDKDDNSSAMLWRPDVCVCVHGGATIAGFHSNTTVTELFILHNALLRSSSPLFSSVAYGRPHNDSRWKRRLSLHKV